MEQFHREPRDTVAAFGADALAGARGRHGRVHLGRDHARRQRGRRAGRRRVTGLIARHSLDRRRRDARRGDHRLRARRRRRARLCRRPSCRMASPTDEVVIDDSSACRSATRPSSAGRPTRSSGRTDRHTMYAGMPVVFMPIEAAQELVYRGPGPRHGRPPRRRARGRARRASTRSTNEEIAGRRHAAARAVDLVGEPDPRPAVVRRGDDHRHDDLPLGAGALPRHGRPQGHRRLDPAARHVHRPPGRAGRARSPPSWPPCCRCSRSAGVPAGGVGAGRALWQVPIIAVLVALLAGVVGLRKAVRVDPALAFAGPGG